MKIHLRLVQLQPMSQGRICLLLVLAHLLLNGGLVQAQTNFALTQARIVAGGGIYTNGPFALKLIIGQPDASAPLTGGGYSLTGGFWAGAAVVQTPGAPLLSITRSGESVVLSWVGPAPGYVLQQSPTIANGVWTDVNVIPATNGNTRNVTVPIAPGNRFFRLVHPNPQDNH